MKEYEIKYNEWLNNPIFDKETKEELESIKGNEAEIEDRFYKDLEFGTAGLRGIIGIGTNRMNKYTVTKATQGLANYIIKKGGQNRGVAIAYDSRNMSKEFSMETALCLNANGIKTYRFDSLRPTPELSFAVRELGCIAGIVITASHNPPEYNGYKVYWEDGAQIVEPIDKEIIAEVNNITDFGTIKNIEYNEALEKGLFNTIGEEIDDKYIAELKKLVVHSDTIKEMQKDIKIVYTPLHGTGGRLVKRILKEIGFENVYVVKEQEEPDGNFPTVSYPNPEDPKAFVLALELAKKVDADIILANDPDADRFGIYVKETIVSSNMTDAIAKEYGVKLFSTLTGFKNIAKIIKNFEEENSYKCLFAYEESYGCIIGTHARDKDGIVAVMTTCEAVAYYKKQGLTLWNQMNKMYEKYGYYKEKQMSITLKGADGAEKIKKMMENMRSNPASEIARLKVKSFGDYQKQEITSLENGEKTSTGLPKSNVLYFDLEKNAWVCVRPSGTEPKIKFYMGVCGKTMADADKQLAELENAVKEMAEKAKK